MKNKIFMYLFFFALLIVIFQYMNEKSIFEAQDNKILSLTKRVAENDSINEQLNIRVAELNYFTLLGNENAMTYFENFGLDATVVRNMVSEEIYEKNLNSGGNPLVTFESQDGRMSINKVKFLNHRWILADFTDGIIWGEVMIEYFFDENNALLLTPIGTVLYPN